MASQNNDVKFEIKTENRNNSYLLWDGELKVKLQDGGEDVTLLVEIFHKDDSKGGEKLFDWTTTGERFFLLSLYFYSIKNIKSLKKKISSSNVLNYQVYTDCINPSFKV